jgi:16S rRNA (cytidine1402-2'-O)-methyltransferase
LKNVTEKPAGVLWVVATPIGNLQDLSPRAVQVLKDVDWIAAEDTRHTGALLTQFGVKSRLISCHEHNEATRWVELLERLRNGESGALVSDAGTPLISDPGYVVVKEVRAAGMTVKVVPGPSSITAALSISGLPTDSFRYVGFLPAKKQAKANAISLMIESGETTVLLESVHRIFSTLQLLDELLPMGSKVFLGRELTKQFEETVLLKAGDLSDWLAADVNRLRGEYVLAVSFLERDIASSDERLTEVLISSFLKQGVSTKAIAAGLSEALELNKKALYQQVLGLRDVK